MTNTGGTPAGWYHAPGDPDGTQRYWDGAQWVGEPQQNQQQQQPEQQQPSSPPPAYQPPAQGQTPPASGAPGAGAGAPPPGYQSFAPANVGTPAEWTDRAVAYVIDLAPIIGAYIVVAILGAVSDVLGLLVGLVVYIGVIAYGIWNFYIVQGKTGQTIGKQKQGIKLVSDANGEPVGGLMAFVRYLVSGAFVLLCCIGAVVNLLSPLWNADKKTYSDKIMKMSVVKA